MKLKIAEKAKIHYEGTMHMLLSKKQTLIVFYFRE